MVAWGNAGFLILWTGNLKPIQWGDFDGCSSWKHFPTRWSICWSDRPWAAWILAGTRNVMLCVRAWVEELFTCRLFRLTCVHRLGRVSASESWQCGRQWSCKREGAKRARRSMEGILKGDIYRPSGGCCRQIRSSSYRLGVNPCRKLKPPGYFNFPNISNSVILVISADSLCFVNPMTTTERIVGMSCILSTRSKFVYLASFECIVFPCCA